MPKCLFPDHHKGSSSGGAGWLAVIPVLAALLALYELARFAFAHLVWILAAAAVLALAWLARSVPFSRAGWRNFPRAVWARWRWRWLTRNLSLSYADRHRRRQLRPRMPRSTSVVVDQANPGRVRYPRARIRPDAYGLVARVRTVPGSGREEFEAHAQHIADAWRCARVQVSQPKPGRLTVRGLRTDPLTVPLPPGFRPPASEVFRPFLGRDEWGSDRYLDLPGVTGVTIGGLPGYGKTSLILSLLDQLAASPAVQLVIIDGKGGGDYADWAERAWIYAGDELPAAAAALEDVHALMRRRFGSVLEHTGHRNAWHAGPSPQFPLIVTVIDECHTFFDLDAVKGTKEAESQVRACRSLTGQLVKKGRSVLFLTLLITQKQTSDAIPTAIRDVCAVGISFATRTIDAGIAALGESIRAYPSYSPVSLQERPGYIGVCTASLPTGGDPFVRLRVPEITEAAATARARETAHLGWSQEISPAAGIPVPVSS